MIFSKKNFLKITKNFADYNLSVIDFAKAFHLIREIDSDSE